MLTKAEKVLDKTLTYEPVDQEGNIKTDLLRIRTDVAKHVSKTLGKEHYSERQEHTGKNGSPLTLNFHNSFNADTPPETRGDH